MHKYILQFIYTCCTDAHTQTLPKENKREPKKKKKKNYDNTEAVTINNVFSLFRII